MRTPVALTPEEIVRLLAKARERRLRDWVMILVTYLHGLRASETLALRAGDVADGYLAIQAAKGSENAVQRLQEHANPLLNEQLAFEQWFQERAGSGKLGGAKLGGRRKRDLRKILHSSQSVKFCAPPSAAGRGETSGAKSDSGIDELLFRITRQRFWQLVRQYAREAGIARGQRYYTKRKPHALKHSIAKHLIQSGRPINEVQLHLRWKSIKTAAIYLVPDQDEVSAAVGKVMREMPAFRKELQQFLFPDTADGSRRVN
jgi:integrase